MSDHRDSPLFLRLCALIVGVQTLRIRDRCASCFRKISPSRDLPVVMLLIMAEATAATVVPTFNDVLAARDRISPYLQPTALHRYPALDERVGTETWVKHENHQPICAFKVRGGVNLVSQLSDDERRRGVVTASTGNHGQSIAYATRLFGVRAIVCVPEGANPVKVKSIRGLGAEIVTHGVDFDDARMHAARLAEERGYRYIHSGNEPDLIAGVGTYTLEILEKQPDIEVIIVPIGGGSGASGTCIVAKSMNPKIQVIGVQSAEAPAAYIKTAVRLMIETTRNLAEPAGAAALAAALQLKERLKGKRVALILSGSNITPVQLRELLAS